MTSFPQPLDIGVAVIEDPGEVHVKKAQQKVP